MPKNPGNKIKIILEYEPVQDSEERLLRAFAIILQNQIKEKKDLTNIQNDIK